MIHPNKTPMHIRPLSIAMLLAIPSFAQVPPPKGEPKDLTGLRESWTRARLQADTPLDKKYLEALQTMKVRFTQKGDLEGALAIDAEIRKLPIAHEASLPVKSGSGGSRPASAADDKKDKDVLVSTPKTALNEIKSPWTIDKGSSCLQKLIAADGALDLGESGYLQIGYVLDAGKFPKQFTFFGEARKGCSAHITFYSRDGKKQVELPMNGAWIETIETPRNISGVALYVFIDAGPNKGLHLPKVELRKAAK